MANVNVRIDSGIKANAGRVFSKLGLTSKAAITLFHNQVMRTNGIPFDLKADSKKEVTLKAIEEIDRIEAHPEG